MARIHLLSPHVADLIAAGEVVERPASVVKELLENSIDAGASAVTLELDRGGVDRIRVTDNGCGMTREDASEAFLRHATSKIAEADDLQTILTLGFRGEALAAIAAVSRIELVTKTAADAVGTRLRLEAGAVQSCEDAGCPDGTDITVENLFYNTPARMKFLKKDAAEGMAALEAAGRVALSHPEVAVRAVRDGRECFHTPGDNRLSSAVYSVCGREFAASLMEVRGESAGITVWGFATRPEQARASRSMQYFFLNGRHIKSRTMMAGLEEAYRDCIMVGKYPGCVLHASIDPTRVDVNVHPSKAEVKFSDERAAFQAVYFAVRSAVADVGRPAMQSFSGNHVPAPDAPDRGADIVVELPTVPGGAGTAGAPGRAADHVAARVGYTPAPPAFSRPAAAGAPAVPAPAPPRLPGRPAEGELPDLLRATEPAAASAAAPAGQAADETAAPPESVSGQLGMAAEAPSFRVLGELFSTYVVVELTDEALVIDKHAAHERILYNALHGDPGRAPAQLLLQPVVVSVPREESALLAENAELLRSFGLLCEDFGGNAVIVRELPACVDAADAPDLVLDIARTLSERRQSTPETLRDELLHTMACKAAVKAGSRSDPAELEQLVEQVLTLPDLRYCPHGRPVALTVGKKDLEKNFRRI